MSYFNGKKILLAGLKGEPGDTPFIGENGNWWIGTTDTGTCANGTNADLVQTTGDSTTAVMSQKAVTDVVFDKLKDYVPYTQGTFDAANHGTVTDKTCVVFDECFVPKGTKITIPTTCAANIRIARYALDKSYVGVTVVTAGNVHEIAEDCWIRIRAMYLDERDATSVLDALASIVQISIKRYNGMEINAPSSSLLNPTSPFEYGAIDNNGYYYDSETQAISTDFMYFPKGTLLIAENRWKIRYAMFDLVSKEFVRGISYTNTGICRVEEDCYAKIICQKLHSPTVTESELASLQNIVKIKYAFPENIALTILKDIPLTFESGDLSNGIGFDTANAVRTTEMMQFGKGTEIVLLDGTYRIKTVEYELYEDVQWIGNTDYVTEKYVFPKDVKAKLVVRRVDNAELASGELATIQRIVKINLTKPECVDTDFASNADRIPSFVKDDLKATIENVRRFQDVGGRKCGGFTFVTDQHSRNIKSTAEICKHIIRQTGFFLAVDGGDILQTYSSDTEARAALSEFGSAWYDVPYAAVPGNHDRNYKNGTHPLSKNAYFVATQNQWKAKKVYHDSDTTVDFYVDDDLSKIRVICIDSMEASMGIANFSNAQLQWLGESVLVDEGWTVIVVTHSIYSALGVANVSTSSVLVGILAAYRNRTTYSNSTYGLNLDYTNAKGNIAMVLQGHNHYDNVLQVNGVCVVMTDTNHPSLHCDAEDNYIKIENTGNSSQYVVDSVVHDANNKCVHFVRFGHGYSRHLHYLPVSVGVGGSATLTGSLSVTSWESASANVATVSGGTVRGVSAGYALLVGTDANGDKEYWLVSVS